MLARLAKVYNHKASDISNLKKLGPIEMIQRLPVSFAKVKAGKTSENLLNKIT